MHVVHTSDPAEAPVKEDGSSYEYVIVHGTEQGNVMVGSDSATDLIGSLIAGYSQIPHDEPGDDHALVARYDHAVVVAGMVQGALMAEATNEGRFDPSTSNEDILTALFNEREVPFEGVTAGDGSTSVHWGHEVPLVLIDTDYGPFTARPVPTGSVVLLRPSTELAYLRSLSDAGMIQLFQAATNPS